MTKFSGEYNNHDDDNEEDNDDKNDDNNDNDNDEDNDDDNDNDHHHLAMTTHQAETNEKQTQESMLELRSVYDIPIVAII